MNEQIDSIVSVPALLVFFRLGAFFASSPFPGPLAPGPLRLIVAAGLAWAFSSSVPYSLSGPLWAALISEVLMGLVMGYLLNLVMFAFAYAGEAVSQQMGLRMPGFANPMAANLSLLGGVMAMLMLGFFSMGPGPMRLVVFLYRMFEVVPVGGAWALGRLELPLVAGHELFAGALQVGGPLIAAVFAAQLVLAILARSVPTLNLFIEGPALTTSSGIIGLIATVNTYGPMAENMISRRFEQIAGWLVP